MLFAIVALIYYSWSVISSASSPSDIGCRRYRSRSSDASRMCCKAVAKPISGQILDKLEQKILFTGILCCLTSMLLCCSLFAYLPYDYIYFAIVHGWPGTSDGKQFAVALGHLPKTIRQMEMLLLIQCSSSLVLWAPALFLALAASQLGAELSYKHHLRAQNALFVLVAANCNSSCYHGICSLLPKMTKNKTQLQYLKRKLKKLDPRRISSF